MSKRALPLSIEKRLMHPALAMFLNARGFDWYYETTLAGRFRIDFMATGQYQTWLIDCKVEPSPSVDIPKMRFYHEIYGDPQAGMVIVIPAHFYQSSKFFKPYADANITLLRLDGDFTSDALDRSYGGGAPYMIDLFPERMHMMSRLTPEQVAEILAADRRHGSQQVLAKTHDVHPQLIEWIWRVVGHKMKHTPTPSPIESEVTR